LCLGDSRTGAGRLEVRPLRNPAVYSARIDFQQCCCNPSRSRPIACFSALSTRCRCDTPAPPVGLSALTPPPPKAGSLQYMAFSGRPCRPARIRVAPPAHGAVAGGRAPGSRPAPVHSAPGPGRARAGLYEWRHGPWLLPDQDRSTSLRAGCRAQPGPVSIVT
jgi:hypothetical protein